MLRPLQPVLVIAALSMLGFAVALTIGIRSYLLERERIVSEIESLKPASVAIILGASVHADHTPSTMLYDRVRAAVELLRAKKVEYLLLSGDTRQANYNEVLGMQKAALELGAAPNSLLLDVGGSHTFDSCYHAKAYFGFVSAIVVTQRFHLPRAMFLCRSLGIQVEGFAADRSRYRDSWKWKVREVFAWILALADVYVTHPEHRGASFGITQEDPQ